MPRGARRNVEWVGVGSANHITGMDSTSILAILSAASVDSEFQEPTVVRLSGCLTFQMDRKIEDPPVSSQICAYHVGIIVHHRDLSGGSLNPLSDVGLPWLWTCSGRLVQQIEFHPLWDSTGGALTHEISTQASHFVQEHTLDARAMRRLRHDEQLSLVTRATKIAGDTGAPENVECTLNIRALLKV